jgi:hypothetical protein
MGASIPLPLRHLSAKAGAAALATATALAIPTVTTAQVDPRFGPIGLACKVSAEGRAVDCHYQKQGATQHAPAWFERLEQAAEGSPRVLQTETGRVVFPNATIDGDIVVLGAPVEALSWGAGYDRCSEWLRDAPTQSRPNLRRLMWMQGYLAHRVMADEAVPSGMTVANMDSSPVIVAKHIERYCQAHPDHSLYDVGNSIWGSVNEEIAGSTFRPPPPIFPVKPSL